MPSSPPGTRPTAPGWHCDRSRCDRSAGCGELRESVGTFGSTSTLGDINDDGGLPFMPTDPRPASHDDHSTEPMLRLTSDSDGAVLQLGVRGSFDWQLFLGVRTAVGKCLAEHPAALILDLCALGDATGFSASLWFTARSHANAMQPPVQLALCVPPDTPLAVRLR